MYTGNCPVAVTLSEMHISKVSSGSGSGSGSEVGCGRGVFVGPVGSLEILIVCDGPGKEVYAQLLGGSVTVDWAKVDPEQMQ